LNLSSIGISHSDVRPLYCLFDRAPHQFTHSTHTLVLAHVLIANR
jgi:hypothetical protein